MALPEIVDHDTWITARRALLEEEKDLTRRSDRLGEQRRRLPMVRVEKDYRFAGAGGEAGLADLFGPHRQLVVQHFMFDPDWDRGCGSCTAMADGAAHPGVLRQLASRGTAFAAVSRAPLERLQSLHGERGWDFPWYSSHDSDFNHDFSVTLDPARGPVRYNFRDPGELAATGMEWMTTEPSEQSGISCFLRDGDAVFHTYSTYGRGVEVMMPAYQLLDLTPLGRQEEWEEPAGRATVLYRSDDAVLSGEILRTG
ncbi:DUF899 domain-containing protein [Pseudonocardia sp. HH130630-07]|uniref:DUF899 domain-containing protein n=1 Tax=Pseudonocardia sp. HH130630-07 TaxID=1690815 RepID=UPI000814DF91|nr:DUF899 domain-containing protein [Pseudonocardia sp. HH130630-07]ANY08350.1 hypothetical protein AFB00_21040 [Pseudonocardia sp. HH130630-07]